MKIFLSYSRHDDQAVRALVSDLQRARMTVWLDEELGGGDAWWTQILEQIRGCDVFVIAVSDNSLGSKPCRAEIDYADALGLPTLPVQVGVVSSFRTDSVFRRQFVDYRNATRDDAIDLVSALLERGSERTPLPDPLPEPPPIPYEYLQRLGEVVRGAAELDRSAQAATVFELRTALTNETDESVRADIRRLLGSMRDRNDVVYPVVRDIDAILGAAAPTAVPPVDPIGPRHDADVTAVTPAPPAPPADTSVISPADTKESHPASTPDVISRGAFLGLLCGVIITSVAIAWLRIPPTLIRKDNAFTPVLDIVYFFAPLPGIVLLILGRGRTRLAMTAAGCGLLAAGASFWPRATFDVLWVPAIGLLVIGLVLLMRESSVRHIVVKSHFAWGAVILVLLAAYEALCAITVHDDGPALWVSAVAVAAIIVVGVVVRRHRRRAAARSSTR